MRLEKVSALKTELDRLNDWLDRNADAPDALLVQVKNVREHVGIILAGRRQSRYALAGIDHAIAAFAASGRR